MEARAAAAMLRKLWCVLHRMLWAFLFNSSPVEEGSTAFAAHGSVRGLVSVSFCCMRGIETTYYAVRSRFAMHAQPFARRVGWGLDRARWRHHDSRLMYATYGHETCRYTWLHARFKGHVLKCFHRDTREKEWKTDVIYTLHMATYEESCSRSHR
jgi:hypothetical protein